MAFTRLPVVPQWKILNGCMTTPDGGFLYVGCRTINYISKIQDDTPPIIKVFHMRQVIQALDIDPAWLASPTSQTKYFAVCAQDGCVQIWDFDKGSVVSAHKGHSTKQSADGNGARAYDNVLLSYMRNRNVLSIGPYEIVIYCNASNSFIRRSSFISTRDQSLAILRCSPFNEDIFAVGTSRGLVLVCDLKQMRIIYTLRGHGSTITSLSWTAVEKKVLWCPPKEPQYEKKDATDEKIKDDQFNSSTAIESAKDDDEIFDIYDYNYLDNEFGAPTKVTKSIGECSDFVGLEKPVASGTSSKFDFVEACENLREEIVSTQKYNSDKPEGNEVTLSDCLKVQNTANLSTSCNEDDSSEGSLDIFSRSSDEDVNIDGAEPKVIDTYLTNGTKLVPKAQQIVHTADVHSRQMEVHPNLDNSKEELNNVRTMYDMGPSEERKEKNVNIAHISRNSNQNGLDRDILLASAASDGSLCIWNTETGGCCDHLRAHGSAHGKNYRIEIKWVTCTSFVATNRMGEITMWNMLPCEAKIKRYKFEEERNKHKFGQHNIAAFSVSPDKETVWSITPHREIICRNIKTQKLIAKYCCASTNISIMRECPDDMNKIALGFVDKRVGILDISDLSPTNISIENHLAFIETAVTALVWSPDNKKLAFGTIDGRVGVINIENHKIPSYTYHPFAGKQVYSMDWHGSSIYVVCNEKLGIYNDNGNNKDAEVIQSIDKVSTICVRKGLLFVGSQSGVLLIYKRDSEQRGDFTLKQHFNLSSRYISEIAWSPITDQFAVVSSSNHISILKFDEAASKATLLRTIYMKDSKNGNTFVKWSNQNANKFLTCGFDGAVRVWDLNCSDDKEIFLKQFHCPMMCGLFLPNDENIVICCGKSTSVEFFNMKLEKSEAYSKLTWLRLNTNPLDHVKWGSKEAAYPQKQCTTAAEKRRQRKAKGKNMEMEGDQEDIKTIDSIDSKVDGCISSELPAIDKKHDEISNLMGNLKIDKPEKDAAAKSAGTGNVAVSPFMKIPPTFMYLTTKEINKDALEKLVMILSNDDKKQLEETVITAKLFRKKADAKELLEEELRNHQNSNNKGIASLIIPQLQYNYKEEIIKCIQNKQLTEWHVSLAPSISYNFWQKCCTAFAEQLMEQGCALQAAAYLLAIHNQDDAISMLIEKNYFKEALLVARIYLQAEDPLIHSITDKWISYLDYTGNFAGAALICALSGQMNRAHEILSKVRIMQPDVENALQLLKTAKSSNIL